MAIEKYIRKPPGQKDPVVLYRLRIRTHVEALDGTMREYVVDEKYPTRKAALEAQEIRWAEIREGKASKEIAEAIDRAAEPTVADLLLMYGKKHTARKAESGRETETKRLEKTIPDVWLPFGSTPPPPELFRAGFKTAQTLGRHYARFGDLRASACVKDRIRDYISSREKAGRKPETIRRELVLISCAYERMSDIFDGRTAPNPVAQLHDDERPAPGEHRERVLNDEEEKTLLARADAASNPEVGLAFRLALGSAMRKGDVQNIDWKMIDWTARTANLGTAHKAARAAKTKGRRPRPRIVYLLPLAYDALKARWETVGRPAEGKVISSYTAQGLKTAIRRVIAGAGIDDFHFQDLRHTVVTRLALSGMSPLQVAKSQAIADARHLETRAFGGQVAAEVHEKIVAGETLSTKELMSVSGHSTPRMLAVYANIDPAQAHTSPATTDDADKKAGPAIRVRKDGERFVAYAQTSEGLIEAEGVSGREAKALLLELL